MGVNVAPTHGRPAQAYDGLWLGAPHPMFGERRSLWAAERASVYLCPPTACGAGICDEPTSAGTVLALSQRL